MAAAVAPGQLVTAAPLLPRFVALAIDAVLYFVVVKLLVRATGGDVLTLAAEADAPLFTLAWAALYEFGFLLLWSATPGKRLLGMYVSQGNGGRVRPFKAALRVAAFHFFFMSFLVGGGDVRMWGWLFFALFGINLTMALTDPQRRALHDRIAGTRVVKGRAAAT